MKLVERRKHAGLIFAAAIAYVRGYNDAGAAPQLAPHSEPIAWFKSFTQFWKFNPGTYKEHTSAVLSFFRLDGSSTELTLIAIAWNDDFVEMIPLNSKAIEDAVYFEDFGLEPQSSTPRLILHAVAALKPDHYFHSVLQSARARNQALKAIESLCLETTE
jgi:hypothetical protein